MQHLHFYFIHNFFIVNLCARLLNNLIIDIHFIFFINIKWLTNRQKTWKLFMTWSLVERIKKRRQKINMRGWSIAVDWILVVTYLAACFFFFLFLLLLFRCFKHHSSKQRSSWEFMYVWMERNGFWKFKCSNFGLDLKFF